LHTDERAVLDDSGVALARRRRRLCLGLVRVREPVRLSARLDRSPADARHARVLQADGAAGDEPEAGDSAVFLRLVESELQPEADAEDRPPRCVALAQRVGGLPEPVHCRPRRPHAGEDGEAGVLEIADELRAEAPDGELDGTDVAGAVARDRDRGHITPFVEGSTSPSRRSAARSARPVALNAASATWCASSPVDSTWRPRRALSARLASTCFASPGSGSIEMVALRRPPRSTAAVARASSIGTTASP